MIDAAPALDPHCVVTILALLAALVIALGIAVFELVPPDAPKK